MKRKRKKAPTKKAFKKSPAKKKAAIPSVPKVFVITKTVEGIDRVLCSADGISGGDLLDPPSTHATLVMFDSKKGAEAHLSVHFPGDFEYKAAPLSKFYTIGYYMTEGFQVTHSVKRVNSEPRPLSLREVVAKTRKDFKNAKAQVDKDILDCKKEHALLAATLTRDFKKDMKSVAEELKTGLKTLSVDHATVKSNLANFEKSVAKYAP